MTEENTALIAIEDIKINALFTQRRGLKAVLKSIEDATDGFVPDLESLKGRDEIAALAYRVSRSKTLLVKAGKDITADWRAKTKTVNGVCNEITEFCDAHRDKIREPLTEWEAARKAEEEEAAAKIKAEEDRVKEEEAAALKKRMEDLERREAELLAREAALSEQAAEPEPETATTTEPDTAPEPQHPRKNPVSNPRATDAFRALREVMRLDPHTAHTWHCNLAMSLEEALACNLATPQEIANEGASRFMKLAFGVVTSKELPK